VSKQTGPGAPRRTMKEVSLFVGLSCPTVSRVFNDPSTWKRTTRLRVEKALETSGFRPNLLADIPLVCVDSRPSWPAAFVGNDNRSSFRVIGKHLRATGSAPIFLGMPRVNANALDRTQAYASAMRAHGREPIFLDLADTLDWDCERISLRAMELLLDRIADGPRSHDEEIVLLDARVVVRHSA